MLKMKVGSAKPPTWSGGPVTSILAMMLTDGFHLQVDVPAMFSPRVWLPSVSVFYCQALRGIPRGD